MKKLKHAGAIILAFSMLLSMNFTVMASSTQATLPEPDKLGSITLHKYEIDSECLIGNDNGTELSSDTTVDLSGNTLGDLEGLKNIGFSITQVTLKDESNKGSTDVNDYEQLSGGYTNTAQTDENGVINWTNLAQGYYLITELENATAATYVDPFIVSIPMTNPTGDGYLYDIHVYPKNKVKEGPDIEKELIGPEEGIGSNTLTWQLRGDIPADIKDAKKYVISDTLDSRLKYNSDSLKVYYIGQDGIPVTLNPGTHYTENFDSSTNTLTISITSEGFQELGKAWESSGRYIPTLYVEFDTMIALVQESPDWETIYNKGTLDYTNSDDYTYEPSETEEVPSNPYGIEIIKVDGDDNTISLSGAKFKIYTSEDDAQNGTNALVNPASATEEWEVTTNSEGKAYIYGLTSGSYWLVETQAPVDSKGKAYNLLTAPVKVTIEESEFANEDYPVEIIKVNNYKGFTLPLTGASGTILFTLGGLALIGMAGVFMILSKKRKVQ